MAIGDTQMPGPPGGDGGGGKLFGLPTPLVLIGGGIVGLLAISTLMKRAGTNTANMVPLSTAVQLGDIQQRQLEIQGDLSKGFAGASVERANYNQSQLQALAGAQTAITDQMKATQQALEQSIAAGDNNLIAKLKDQSAFLANMLNIVRTEQNNMYMSLLGNINQGNQNGIAQYSSIIDAIQALAKGNNTISADAAWYGGWRNAFGSSVPEFDLNMDNLVDIRDLAIWRQRGHGG